MGSVGSIEKVMVGGILAIILLILCVAINGTQDDPNKVEGWTNGGENSDVPKLTRDDRPDPRNLSGPGIDGGSKPKNSKNQDVVFNLTPENDSGLGETAPPPPPLGIGGDDLKPLVTPPPTLRQNYTVKSGDNFSFIAQRVLGSVSYVGDLKKANEDVDDTKMHVGQVLNLPQVGLLAVGGAGAGNGSNNRRTDNVVADDAPVKPASTVGRTHRVAAGETLWAISTKYYGNGERWQEILAANRNVLTKDKDLAAGMVLAIP